MESKLPYPDNVIPTLQFQFCPMCTTALVREVIFDDNIPRVKCPNCGWIQLLSNVVGVVTIAKSDQGIVAILPPNEDGIGFPAGLVEYGEHPEVAAVREVYEETGLEAVITDCLGWFFSDRITWPGPLVQFMYEARITGGELKGSDEGEARIFPEAELPAVSSYRTGSRKAIDAYISKVNKGRH
jgi:ADP-ribose pyrophosphatase YjhB (NUDIX family)